MVARCSRSLGSALIPAALMVLSALGPGCRESRETHVKFGQVDSVLYGRLQAKRVFLPNGWALASAGRPLSLGDLPLNLAASPSGKYLAVTNNGFGRQSITLIDAQEGRILDDVEIERSWVGLKFSSDEKSLYVSGGNDNNVKIYRVENNKLSLKDSVTLGPPWPKAKISVAGIDIDDTRKRLYAVTKDDSSLYVCGLENRNVLQRVALPSEGYTCLVSPSANELYVSLWGSEQVAVYDLETYAPVALVRVEGHPNDLALSNDGRYLFVANANSNSVSVVDTKLRRTVETISTSLYPDAPGGSTTNGVALSEDGKMLFIANADNNCLAVFDVSSPGQSKSMGFVPTDWYPAAVRVVGNLVFVANGKGGSSFPNPEGPNPFKKSEGAQYLGGLLKGTLSIIDIPDEIALATYSRVVYENTPYNKQKEQKASGEEGNPVPREVGKNSPIKYVFYIIKENRTYDQFFGDMPEGNGDSTLCLFPERDTPNHHALARAFVLLDNFYVDAEVSADGHNWSTAAYATDYVEKTWPTLYGGRGGTYDFEGSRKIAYPSSGYIWDYCSRAGVSYRSYGEFVEKGKSTGLPSLIDHIDADYPAYDLDIRDNERVERWIEDFDSLLAVDAVPRFNSIRLPNDHTYGARVGKPTPRAMVADNDLALGRLVDHLSHSRIWGESAIFVLEDDAQNGPDHVDAHRSIALVIGPFVKRGILVSEMYSTSSVLRTIELILGLPPMSQYDAAAEPIWKCFTERPDLTPYNVRPSNADLDEINVAVNESSRRSETFDLDHVDAAPDYEFSEVIWKAVKGESSEMPPPRRSAFVRVVSRQDLSDD